MLSGSSYEPPYHPLGTNLAVSVSLQGVARMSDPKLIKEIQAAVTIPVMAKVRIGHYVEAQVPRVVPCHAKVRKASNLGIRAVARVDS